MEFTPNLIVKGTVKRCVIGNFHVIAQENAPASAYVAYKDDAKLYAAAFEMMILMKEAKHQKGLSEIFPKLHAKILSVLAKVEGGPVEEIPKTYTA